MNHSIISKAHLRIFYSQSYSQYQTQVKIPELTVTFQSRNRRSTKSRTPLTQSRSSIVKGTNHYRHTFSSNYGTPRYPRLTLLSCQGRTVKLFK